MKGFLKTSEIGKSTMVTYRAKILGIEPIKRSNNVSENIYSIEDADRILAYKPKNRNHGISYYEKFVTILNNDKFRYNIPYASKIFKLKESKIQAMLDEYNKNELFFIAPSKMNNDI
jgi:hypothetical protein